MQTAIALVLLLPGLLRSQEVDREQFVKLLQLPKQEFKYQFWFESNGKRCEIANTVDDPLLLARIEQLRVTWNQHPEDWRLLQELWALLSLTKQDDQRKSQLVLMSNVLKEQVKRHPASMNLRIGLAYVLNGLDQKEDAKWIGMALVDQFPNEAEAWGVLGLILESSQPQEASKAYEHAMKLQSEEGQWHLAYATSLLWNYVKTVMNKEAINFDELLAYRYRVTSPQSQSAQKSSEDKNKESVVPATFVPNMEKENTEKKTVAPNDYHIDIFRSAKLHAGKAADLLRKHNPDSSFVLCAVLMENIADACIQPVKFQNYAELLANESQSNEMKRMLIVRPTHIAFHLSLFIMRYTQLAIHLQKEHPQDYALYMEQKRTLKSICSSNQWEQLAESLALEKQLATLPPEEKAPAEHAVAVMHFILQNYEQASQHAKLACELSPQTNSYWGLLSAILSIQEKHSDCYELRGPWLKNHPTADTQCTLALTAAKLNDWKAARQHVTAGLKLDPKHWKLRLADIVVDLKLDSSPENVKNIRQRSDRLFEDARLLQPAPALLPPKEAYLAFINVDALSGQYEHAHSLLQCIFAQNERRGDPDLTKALQLLGSTGLKPPSLVGP